MPLAIDLVVCYGWELKLIISLGYMYRITTCHNCIMEMYYGTKITNKKTKLNF